MTTRMDSQADEFSGYERGLGRLLSLLGSSSPRYSDALTYQQRLSESIEQSRRYGDTASRKADRATIIAQLNGLALSELGRSFNELCSSAAPVADTQSSALTAGQPQPAALPLDSLPEHAPLPRG